MLDANETVTGFLTPAARLIRVPTSSPGTTPRFATVTLNAFGAVVPPIEQPWSPALSRRTCDGGRELRIGHRPARPGDTTIRDVQADLRASSCIEIVICGDDEGDRAFEVGLEVRSLTTSPTELQLFDGTRFLGAWSVTESVSTIRTVVRVRRIGTLWARLASHDPAAEIALRRVRLALSKLGVARSA